MNARNIVMRDPAYAALVGAIPDDNFGAESDFGTEFGCGSPDDFNPVASYDGAWDDGSGQSYWGYEFGADAPAAPPPAVAAQLWHQHAARVNKTERRASLLEPNKGSEVKVERYSFAVNQGIILGTAAALTMSGQPDTNIRPQRVTINAPAPGFATISEIKVANVSVTVGGTHDAFDWNAAGVGQSLDMPTLSPSNKATVLGNYTGFVPPGFVGATAYTLACSFKGPASIVA